MTRRETGRAPVRVPREVYQGIEAVRLSGLTNMLDRPTVARLAEKMDFDVAARWVRENRDLYARGVFHGFEVVDEKGSDQKPLPPGATFLVGEADDGARVVSVITTGALVLVEADGRTWTIPPRHRRAVLGSHNRVASARTARDGPRRRPKPRTARGNAPRCPCGCDGRIADHDDRGWGPWPCPVCDEDSDRDLDAPCSDCEEARHADR